MGASGTAQPLISARDLYAGYGKKPVLKKCSLTVEAGSLTGFCGPNGAGKSTFLKLCLGMLRPQQGSITVMGARPGQAGFREILLRIGYVPQNTQGGTLPATVREAVAMGRYGKAGLGRRLSPQDKLLVEAAMEAVGITTLAKQQVQKLSGGQTQRVAIARALAMEPEILMLDEPTSNLDWESRMELLRVIKSQQEYQGLTTVLVSHSADTLSECGAIYRFTAGSAEKLAEYQEGLHA
ncbi:MAG: metal ABC transporter ATP-binding protein [Treponema sp.]|jgi:ABC-type Mn2+/Zn2+ transport system ATPase subunit|nr:metal ABC transporter ATP-binding protein [Treponema sp.]